MVLLHSAQKVGVTHAPVDIQIVFDLQWAPYFHLNTEKNIQKRSTIMDLNSYTTMSGGNKLKQAIAIWFFFGMGTMLDINGTLCVCPFLCSADRCDDINKLFSESIDLIIFIFSEKGKNMTKKHFSYLTRCVMSFRRDSETGCRS